MARVRTAPSLGGPARTGPAGEQSSQKYTQGAFPALTPRERDVLDLLVAGKRNSVIARELSLSEKTVRNHLSSILAKLQVADRSAAIVRAREAGLGRS